MQKTHRKQNSFQMEQWPLLSLPTSRYGTAQPRENELTPKIEGSTASWCADDSPRHSCVTLCDFHPITVAEWSRLHRPWLQWLESPAKLHPAMAEAVPAAASRPPPLNKSWGANSQQGIEYLEASLSVFEPLKEFQKTKCCVAPEGHVRRLSLGSTAVCTWETAYKTQMSRGMKKIISMYKKQTQTHQISADPGRRKGERARE
jgi:hypothetical protein